MKHLRILLASLLAIVGATTGMAQTNYGVSIGGKPITSANYTNITSSNGFTAIKSGTVSFAPDTRTLTLTNATIQVDEMTSQAPYAAIANYSTLGELTIKLVGSNVVRVTVETSSGSSYNAISSLEGNSLTITGGGSLLLEKTTNLGSIISLPSAGSDLTISGCSVSIKSSTSNTWIWGINLNSTGTVTINGANVDITDVQYPLENASSVVLQNGTELTEPEGAVYDSSSKRYTVNGTRLTGHLKFETPKSPYAVLNGSTLTFYYDEFKEGREGTKYLITNYAPDWINNTTITTVNFDASYANYRPTTAQQLFEGLSNLTTISNISRLHTDNVTNMNRMFSGCSKLTSLNLSSFKTENVTGMYRMFYGCSSLTSLNLSSFNTENVTSMSEMFRGCYKLSQLDVSGFTVKYIDVSYMFTNCSILTTIYCNDTWSPSSSSSMFSGCTKLVGGNGTAYNSSNVTATYAHPDVEGNPGYFTEKAREPYAVMNGTKLTFYYDAKKLTRTGTRYAVPWTTKPTWNSIASSITTVTFDPSFANYRLTSAASMFEGMSNLTAIGNIEYLNTENVTTMYQMFYNCSKLVSLDLSHFETKNVTSMLNMFTYCNALTILDVTSFDTEKVTNMSNMFANCYNLTTIRCNDDWNTSTVTNSDYMFLSSTKLVGGNGTTYNSSYLNAAYAHPDAEGNPGYFTTYIDPNAVPYAVTSTDGTTLTFYFDTKKNQREGTKHDIPWEKSMLSYPGWTSDSGNSTITTATFDASFANYHGLTHTINMFYKMTALTQINDLPYLHTENVTDMSNMFYHCNSLTSLDVSYFDTHQVESMAAMFCSCGKLTSINVSGFNTEKVGAMQEMFSGCYELTDLDVSGFDTHNVVWMNNMFGSCRELTQLDVSGFNVQKVVGISEMFSGCKKLKIIDVSNFNTENLSSNPYYTMSSMFAYCESVEVLDLSNFNTAKVRGMKNLFYNCKNLKTIYCNDDWNTSTLTESADMFTGCTALIGGNGTAYDASHVDATYAHPDAEDNPGYFTKLETAYAVLSTDGKTLTFYYDTERNSHTGTKYSMTWTDYPGWTSSEGNSTITTAEFDWSFSEYHGLTDVSNMFFGMKALTEIYCLEYLNTENVTNMMMMFRGCSALRSLDLSTFKTANVTNMRYMFWNCSSLTSLDLSSFNTENVLNMVGMFRDCSSLTSLDLTNFNIKNAFNIDQMFLDFSNLETIYCNDNWNTSTVTGSTDWMFLECTKLKGSNGTEYSEAGQDVTYAHPDAAGNPGYFTAKVVPYALVSEDGETLTFYYDTERNEREGTAYSIPWNTSTVPGWTGNNWRYNYNGTTTTVNFDISFADYHGLTNTSHMFENMRALKTINNLERLNTENVTDMTEMFRFCDKLESLDVSHFNTSKVKYFYFTFSNCTSLTSLDLSNFDTSNCENMYHMFTTSEWSSGKSKLKSINMSGWDTRKVTTMSGMFSGLTSLESIDVSHFNTENVAYMSQMFMDCSSLKNLDLSNFNTEKVCGEWYSMEGMFWGCSSLETLNISSFNTAKVENMSSMFSGCSSLTQLDLTNFNTEKVTNMKRMFYGSTNLETIYCNDNWNTSTLTESTDMFKDCTSLVGGNGTSYDANNVTAAYAHPDAASNPGYFTRFQETDPVPYALLNIEGKKLTFYYDGKQALRPGTKYSMTWDNYPDWTDSSVSTAITKATFDPSFDNYHNLTNASYMFYNMRNLTEIVDLRYLHTEDVTTMSNMFSTSNKLTTFDVSGFDTHNVTDMSQMFAGCPVSSLDLSNFNTENVTNMYRMFRFCTNITSLDLKNFNTANVENMSGMFGYCSSLTSLDLRNFDTKNVTDMSYMFSGCSNLETIYCNDDWNRSTVTESGYMFGDCNKLTGGEGTTCNPNIAHSRPVAYAHPDGGTSNPGYFTWKALPGDVNQDGYIDIADVTKLVNKLLNNEPADELSDIDGNGELNNSDTKALVNNVLGNTNMWWTLTAKGNISSNNWMTFSNTDLNINSDKKTCYHSFNVKAKDFTSFYAILYVNDGQTFTVKFNGTDVTSKFTLVSGTTNMYEISVWDQEEIATTFAKNGAWVVEFE